MSEAGISRWSTANEPNAAHHQAVGGFVCVPDVGEARLWDDGLKGFFVRVYPTGRRVYAVKFRLHGRQGIYTIGVHGSPWTPDQAREAAKKALGSIAQGFDPNDDKRRQRRALTVGELIDVYLKDGPGTKPAKRASSWENDASNLNRHIRPLIGGKLADAVTRAEAYRAIGDIANGKTAVSGPSGKKRGRIVVKGGSGVAARTRATTAAMFAWGNEHQHISENPFRGLKLKSAPMRGRFLNHNEVSRLLDAITSLEASGEVSQAFGDAIRLLLLTGARKTEILGLRWDELDLKDGEALLPPDRTKAGGANGERRIKLSPPACKLLSDRHLYQTARIEAAATAGVAMEPSPFVFPAARGGGHMQGLRRAFLKVCKKAELTEFRIHDLRHSFASLAIASGASLFLVGKLIGHSTTRTTERYAHLVGDPLKDIVDGIGSRLMRPEGDEVTPARPMSARGEKRA